MKFGSRATCLLNIPLTFFVLPAFCLIFCFLSSAANGANETDTAGSTPSIVGTWVIDVSLTLPEEHEQWPSYSMMTPADKMEFLKGFAWTYTSDLKYEAMDPRWPGSRETGSFLVVSNWTSNVVIRTRIGQSAIPWRPLEEFLQQEPGRTNRSYNPLARMVGFEFLDENRAELFNVLVSPQGLWVKEYQRVYLKRKLPDTTPADSAPSAETQEAEPAQPAVKGEWAQTASSNILSNKAYMYRLPGARGSALATGGGGIATEISVLRALRWLKQQQAPDGSWPKTKPAMTGLAILAFLAHGETPASEEFGATVESALKWMLKNQEENGHFLGRDGHDYSHPIAAYALSEAYGMTNIREIRLAADKAIEVIVKGQNPEGGWDYNLRQSTRNDTCYMSWCAQAVKAAKMAGLQVEGLDWACKNAVNGFKLNAQGDAAMCGFGYTSPGQSGLSAAGALCMQILGAGDSPEVIGSLKLMDEDRWAFKLVDAPIGKSGLYYFYYATQAKFNAGGSTWNNWNKQFCPELVKGQTVITKSNSRYVDHKGEPRDIGYWDQYQGHGNNENPVYSTLLALLQLEVYYRYAPVRNKDM